MKHFSIKLFGTIRILYCLGMARTFGRYIYSTNVDGFDYARYFWKGKTWAVPITHCYEHAAWEN